MVVTAADAESLMTEIRTYLCRTGYVPGKMFRPWEIDADLYSSLDQDDAWMGWEFETGWRSADARLAVVTHIHDTWDNMCFDYEGEGSNPVEITFAPANESSFDDGTAPAFQFMQYVNTNQQLIEKTGYSHVGTHLNFSTPAIRADGGRSSNRSIFAQKVADVINNSIHKLPQGDHRHRYFGRNNIYGGAYLRSDPASTTFWIECKLFRTAYTLEEFRNYMRTGKALIRIAKYLEDAANVTVRMFVSNLEGVIERGEEPILEDGGRYMSGSADGSYVSGGDYGYDEYEDDEGCDCCGDCDGDEGSDW